jgi:hypothetical protein
MDDTSFMSSGTQEHAIPPGERSTATEEEKRAGSATLPEAKGQFGRDISTEECPSSNALGQRGRWLNGGTGSSGWRG